MHTMEETSIMVSLCNMTLSELLFSWSENWMWVCDEFDNIFDELNILLDDSSSSSTDDSSEWNLTEEDKLSWVFSWEVIPTECGFGNDRLCKSSGGLPSTLVNFSWSL